MTEQMQHFYRDEFPVVLKTFALDKLDRVVWTHEIDSEMPKVLATYGNTKVDIKKWTNEPHYGARNRTVNVDRGLLKEVIAQDKI